MMRTVVFDISGPYGHFRKPYAPVSPVTYPFPPPPTVLGMVGAIIGYGKDEYLERIGWNQVRVGIRLLVPTRKYRTGINLILTHEGNKYFRLKPDGPGKAARGQYPYEFLKDPAFRIWITGASPESMEALENQLRSGTTVFTPSLGLAQCLAEITFVGCYDAWALPFSTYQVYSIVPDDLDTCHFEPGNRYVRYRVPAKMKPDRTVVDYREVLVAEEGQGVVMETDKAYKVGDETILFF